MTIFLTTLLILLCLVIVLLILIQRTSGGMGSALGGGAADQVLGAGSASQLTRLTVYGILGFFILAVWLYIEYQGAVGKIDTFERTGIEIKSGEPSSVDPNQPLVPPPPPSSDSLPVSPSVPASFPLSPEVEVPLNNPSPAEGNKSE